MKNLSLLLLGAAVTLLLGAAASTTLYRGTFVGTYYGNGGNLTNITVSPTNTLSSLTVQGAVGADGIVGAVRRSAGQTNDIFQVQTEVNAFLFGVESNGVPRAATYRATSTNNFILRDDNGGSWILRVSTGGTLSAVTNTTRL